jgi:hypothetical protein
VSQRWYSRSAAVMGCVKLKQRSGMSIDSCFSISEI